MGICSSSQTSSSADGSKQLSVELPNTFKSKYTKGRQLGKGGYSVVYECVNKVTNVRYAVKEITRASMQREDEKSLKEEIEILRSLNHNHIVRFVDYFEESTKYYVVLELLEGGELFDRIVKKTVYNEKEARDLVRVLFTAIKYCHDHNIVHRDLKPENLLLTSASDDADVKVADFGFATKTQGSMLTLTTTCGSPGYIAPEILEKNKYGLQVDMWSLGVITYILLGGYPPFHDDHDQAALFRKIRKGVFKFHPQYWDHISQEAKDLISGLLTLDVLKRLTIDQALHHPWLHKPDEDLAQRNLTKNLESFRHFHATRKLRGAVRAIIATNRLRRSTTDSPRLHSTSISPHEDEDDTDWLSSQETRAAAAASAKTTTSTDNSNTSVPLSH